MASDKTLIFVPTYNERENVAPMCDQVLALGLDADLLFLDDNSPDGTGDVLDGLAEKHPRVSVIHRSGKLGIGGAHQDGIAYAYEHHYRTLVTLDCDFTHSPADIPRLMAGLDGADLVVGSRFLEEGSLPGWSPLRKTLTSLGHFLTQHMLGIGGDATGAFRAYRLATIPQALFDVVQSRGYAFFFESLYTAHQNGLTVRDVPIVLPARTYGHSKMNLREVQRSVQQLMSLYVAGKANPARFRMAHPPAEVNPDLQDPQGWDSYWAKKQEKTTAAYEVVAATYRNVIIRPSLSAAIRREFAKGAHLLHAGCGSGQVDADLHDDYRVTAVDISVPALELYRRHNPKAYGVKHASIFELPFPDASFDGAYNLGVVEHFTGEELERVLCELKRVVKPGGKLVVFWPHKRASSALVLDSIHFVLNDVLKKDTKLHPPEVSRIESKAAADAMLSSAGFDLQSYSFGPRDLFVQAVVVGVRR